MLTIDKSSWLGRVYGALYRFSPFVYSKEISQPWDELSVYTFVKRLVKFAFDDVVWVTLNLGIIWTILAVIYVPYQLIKDGCAKPGDGLVYPCFIYTGYFMLVGVISFAVAAVILATRDYLANKPFRKRKD